MYSQSVTNSDSTQTKEQNQQQEITDPRTTQSTEGADSETAAQLCCAGPSPVVVSSIKTAELQATSSSDAQVASGSQVSSIQRKTWSARLRDKLEKREKDAAAAAEQQKIEAQQEKKSKIEQSQSSVKLAKKTSNAQKKNKHRLHHLASDGTALTSGGMMGGQRPNQGKSTSYHLTPSLLEDVLNEKKMSLMRSPEVVEHLQLLQRDVSINRLLSTAPVVKTEAEAASAQVKSERNPPEPARPPNTIGHVMVVNIKKESDNSCGIDDQPGRNSPSTDSQEQGKTQNNKDREEQNVTRDFDDRSNNPLDLTAHRADAS